MLARPYFNLYPYQEAACKDAVYAYYFAENIPQANIARCQLFACEKASCAYYFARCIPGADLAFCRKACKVDVFWLNQFNKMVIERAMI